MLIFLHAEHIFNFAEKEIWMFTSGLILFITIYFPINTLTVLCNTVLYHSMVVYNIPLLRNMSEDHIGNEGVEELHLDRSGVSGIKG